MRIVFFSSSLLFIKNKEKQRIVTYNNFWCDITEYNTKNTKTLNNNKKTWIICFTSVCNLSRETIHFSLFRVLWSAKKNESNLKWGNEKKIEIKRIRWKLCGFLNWVIAFALFFLLLCAKNKLRSVHK